MVSNGNLARKIELDIPNEVDFTDDPLKWCTVSLHDVVARGKRLEASVFDVEAKQAKELLKNGKYPLTTICGNTGLASAYTCARFKRIWVEKSEYPIYQPSSITDIKPKPDGYLSRNTRTDIEFLRVHKGQVLLTCSGTIGNLAYVADTLDNKIFSHDLLRIDFKNAFDVGFVYAYLKSNIGHKILLSNSYGTVITHIEATHLDSVPIPNAPIELKKRINDLMVQSYALRDGSNDLIDKATQLLIDELQLPPIEEMKDRSVPVETFSVKLSQSDRRLDASYHVPIVEAIEEHLKAHAAEVTTIGDGRISKDVILPGRFKRVYVEKGYGRVFIGGKQLWELDPTNKKYLSIAHHAKRIKDQLELHENMTLITCSGTVGKVALVGKHWENWTANQHIIRVIPQNNELAGYLYIFLNTEYGKALIERHTYGSVVDEITDEHVANVKIPLLKNETIQKNINDLALEANKLRYHAYLLEQQAIKEMNEKVIYA